MGIEDKWIGYATDRRYIPPGKVLAIWRETGYPEPEFSLEVVKVRDE